MPDVLVIGAGCFGISTAYHILKRGYQNVTVIDRSDVLPAPDAASTDYNKVVRSSYSDPFYAQLAKEAIHAWKSEEWGNTYHESGVLILSSLTSAVADRKSYVTKSYENDVSLGASVIKLADGEAIRARLSQRVNLGSFTESSGYVNHDGGWANATHSLQLMMNNVIAEGGKIIAGKTVSKLLKENGRSRGVECDDGTCLTADIIILATGSWTASTFRNLDLRGKCLATGRCVAFIQLTAEEADLQRDFPVVLDFASGFTMFPPNEENVIKVTVDSTGYINKSAHSSAAHAISTPRTVLSHAQDGLRIPKATLSVIRNNLQAVCPDLAKKPFVSTRLCWYTDSPDEDWVIGSYPSDPSLVLATGGSGHAFKFLPVIGRLVADVVESTLEPDLAKKFAVDRDCTERPLLRYGGLQELKELRVEELCSPEDLHPV